MSRKALVALATLAALVLAAPAYAEEPVPDPVVDVAQPPARVQVLPQRCVGAGTMPTTARACHVLRHGPRRPVVVVWGDSHSWQQVRAITSAARAVRSDLVTFQMGGCPPMLDDSRTACAEVGRLALGYLRRAVRRGRDVTVVVGGAWTLYRYLDRVADLGMPIPAGYEYLTQQAARLEDGAPRMFHALDRLGVRTVGVAPVPVMLPGVSPPDCDVAAPVYGCELDRAIAIPGEAAVDRWLADRVDRLVDVTPWLCDAVACHPTVGGRPTMLDALHLDPAVADAFAPAYRRALR